MKLSPSDLIIEGHDFIEGRAHDVFEAVSMLTRCVIIFDEFEPVLTSRKKPDVEESPDELRTNALEIDTAYMSKAIQRMNRRDDPKSRYVFGGMLPKFGKLHDAAKDQFFVYCLGTNHLNEIDDAAKRTGRFDVKLPIYKPDVLARVGTWLLRLVESGELERAIARDFSQVLHRFEEVIRNSAGKPADQVAGDVSGSQLSYILLKRGAKFDDDLKRLTHEQRVARLLSEMNTAEPDSDVNEAQQRAWFISYENSYRDLVARAFENVLPSSVKDIAES